MNDKENLATDQVDENVGATTEEAEEKRYSEAELNEKVNEIAGRRTARLRAKLEKEYARKYGDLENVLRAGSGNAEATVDELTETFKSFYRKNNVDIPERKANVYTDREVEILANAEADEIIQAGYDEVVDEVDRLSALGSEKMTAREKAMLKKLSEHRSNLERGSALAKIGVTEDVYNSEGFKSFAKKFDSKTPITEVYAIYEQTQPKKEIKTAGSMKSNSLPDNGVKDYYSPEEAKKFTKADFDKNPELYKAVIKSMAQWKK